MNRRRSRGRALGPALAAGALALALTGCVEYRESVVLERDGSGVAVLEAGLNEALARAAALAGARRFDAAAAAEAAGAVDGVTVTASRGWAEGGTRWVRLELAFESVSALAGLGHAPGYEDLFGGISVTDAGAGELRFRRSTGRGAVGETGAVASGLLAPVLDRYRWRFEVKVPTRVADARGPGAEVDAARRTARWDVSLGEVLSGPRRLEAVYARPGLGPAGVALGAALMLTAVGAALLVARARRRR